MSRENFSRGVTIKIWHAVGKVSQSNRRWRPKKPGVLSLIGFPHRKTKSVWDVSGTVCNYLANEFSKISKRQPIPDTGSNWKRRSNISING